MSELARIIYISNVEKMTGRSRQTLRRWWEKGYFPKPGLIGNRLGWDPKTIEKWINKELKL